MKPIQTIAIALLVTCGLFVLACGSDDDSAGDTGSESPSATATQGARAAGDTASGAEGENTPASSSATGQTGAGDAAATIEITASDLQFDKQELTAPAETEVTLVFHNEDDGVPHDVAFFETEAAEAEIFSTGLVTGVETSTGTFTTPAAGTYFFRCNVHPDTMTGTFTVQ